MRYAHLLFYINTLEFLEACSSSEVSVNSGSVSILGPFGAVPEVTASPLLKVMFSGSSGNLCVRCGHMRGWEGKDVERRVDGRVGGEMKCGRVGGGERAGGGRGKGGGGERVGGGEGV